MTKTAGRRRADSPRPPEYDLPTREPRIESPRTARLLMFGVLVAWIIGTARCRDVRGGRRPALDVERPGAVLLLIVFSVGLTHRVGGHMRIWASLVAVLAIAAVASRRMSCSPPRPRSPPCSPRCGPWSSPGRPSRSCRRSREYVLAIVVALSGTVAVAAWNAPVNYQRFNLVVLAVALGLAIMVVWNLGAGLHGLGRQNLLILAGVAALMVLVLAYSSFVRTHGSQMVTDTISDW